MEQKSNQQANIPSVPPKKNIPMYLIAIVVTLAVLTIALGVKLYLDNQTLNEKEEAIKLVEKQKIGLEVELNELIIGYDSLKTDNDSINQELEVEQNKIRRLLRINASNSQKIKMYQKELGTLRKIMRSYIVQIDSLNTLNIELTAENTEVKEQLQQVESDFEKLTETKEELTSVVEQAQKLAAKNVLGVGLNSKSKPKDKVDKVAKIRVCFSVRENKIAETGKKLVYLQLIRPDNVTLSSPEAATINVGEDNIVYSAKRELEFDKMDIDMCIYWDAIEELIPGNYTINLYCEGHKIGTSTMTLK